MVHGITIDANGVSRCAWPGNDELYIEYHDKEWGYPEGNDKKLFEKISLEGFQAGLAWITILRKREHFREAFSNFDFNKISKYGEKEIQVLKSNAGIVRHEGKIRSVINNSHRAKELISEKGSLKNYFWYFSQFVTEDLYDEIFEYCLPQRQGFKNYSAGQRRDDKIFDETAVVGVQEFASRLQAGIVPNFARWADLVGGQEVPEEERLDVNKALDDVTEYVFEVLQNIWEMLSEMSCPERF